MRKICLLVCLLFFLCGCSIDYNLEFIDASFIEKINIGPVNSKAEEEMSYMSFFAIKNNKYDKLYNLNYSNDYLKLKYKYSVSDFELARTFNECYELSNISYDDNYYYIYTSNEFKCMSYLRYSANEVKINFKTNHEVVEVNADYIDGDTYTWVINENNSNNKPIKLKMVKEVVSDKLDNNEDKNKYESIFLMLLGVVVIIGIVVGFSLYKRIRVMNKI